jgi:hypothetical protein
VSGAKSHYRDVDLNVLNFERVKWGGVRHGKLEYTWFDLQQLEQAEIPEPSPADLAVFQAILAVIAASAPGDYPGALEQNLAPALPSSKNERRSLIEILACARILEPGSHDRPGRGKTDWNHAADWRGVDRYNADSVCSHFGAWMPPIETSV